MKLYNVYVYNTRDYYNDVYMVQAMTPWTPAMWRFSG